MTYDEVKKALEGVCGISITTFNESLEIDEVGFRKHLRYMVDRGINKENGTMVIGGSTGECGGMTSAERKKILEISIDEIGKDVPIIAGCNHTSTHEVVELVQHAEEVGAEAVMILSPFYYIPPDEAILRFFKYISDNSSLPIMLYNNLEVTHKDISIEVLEKLIKDTNVVGIKECTPNFAKMEKVARVLGEKMTVINGHGEFLEPFAALAGTKGFISTTANFAPELAIEIWRARSIGDYVKAKKLRDKLSPYLDLMVKYTTQFGEPAALSIIKRACDIVGSFGGYGRVPLIKITPKMEKDIHEMLEKINLI